jgi:8-oxo-dGTP pyrophosphatase MutT (NUDIX family)
MGAPHARIRADGKSAIVTGPADLPIRDAATIILLRRSARGADVLMGMRGSQAVFMPSKYVFPGGAVDPGDATAPLAATLAEPHRRRIRLEARDGTPSDPEAIAAAALRELAEETGLLIGRPDGPPSSWPGYAEAGLSPDPRSLIYLFRAITPPGRSRRFDAHFLLADAASISGDADDFSRACDELSHLHWVPLGQAKALDLPFITEVVLSEVAELIAGLPHDATLPVPETVPFFDNRSRAPRFLQLA